MWRAVSPVVGRRQKYEQRPGGMRQPQSVVQCRVFIAECAELGWGMRAMANLARKA